MANATGASLAHKVLAGSLAAAGVGFLALSAAGQWAPTLDVVNHFLPVWAPCLFLIALLIGAAGRNTGRFRRLAGLFLFFATLFSVLRLTANEFIGPSAIDPGANGPALKLVSYNFKGHNLTPVQAAGWITDSGADIVVLLEAPRRTSLAFKSLAAVYPYQIDCLLSERRCSTFILSKHPPLSSESLGGGDPNNRKGLSAVKSEFCFSGAAFSVIAVHLSRPWPGNAQKRDIETLLHKVRDSNEQNVLVSGDFNLTPWSFTMRTLDQDIGLRRVTRALSTWPADREPAPAFMPLDHLYAGAAMIVHSVKPGPANGSDHRPIIAEFSVATQNAPPC